MSRLATRLLLLCVLVALGLTVALSVRRWQSTTPADATLRAATRTDPVTFNGLLASDFTSLVVSRLLHTSLVRINHSTQQLEPSLAETWSFSDAGTRAALTLRSDARFSDGQPVTADDVVFSFAAVYDERLDSGLADGLRVNGTPLRVRAIDPHTVEIVYPAPYGPGLRPLHALPILPKHRLEAALASGTLRDTWTLATPPGDIVGAGPFVLTRYEPGVAMHFEPNPHAWQQGNDNATLPRLSQIELRLLPTLDGEMLQLSSGELDVTTADLRPEDLPEARRLAEQGALQVFELGVALNADVLWFNLVPGAEATRDRPWLGARALREAIAHAVDRDAFIDAVYQGAGAPVTSIITPGNVAWHAGDIEPRAFATGQAAALLDGLGLVDRDGDGVREDGAGQPARFSVLVQQGHTSRQRAMTVVQEMLRAVGLQMDIVSLDANALLGRYGAGAYEAMYHVLPSTDTDPAGQGEFWLSSGTLHLWHPRQSSPATTWEAEIDRLFRSHLATVDVEERRALIHEAQRIFNRELPAIYFAAPRVHVAVSGRLTNVRPGLLAPQVLWNAGEIGVR